MPPIYLAGHSLGAARAVLYAHSRAARGLPVAGVYAFGCPNPGDARLASTPRHVPVWRSIKNGRDLVPDVPVDIALLGEQYVQPVPLEEAHAAPSPGDAWGPFAWHHIELYQAGCRALAPTGNGAAVELVQAVDAVADLYTSTAGWEWLHPVDGQYWGMRVAPSGARLLIARGSVTALDWLDDFDAVQIDVLGARVSAGFWAGVSSIQAALDAAVAA